MHIPNQTLIFSCFLACTFLYGPYVLLSKGNSAENRHLQLRRFIPCAIAVTVAWSLWLWAGLPVSRLFPHVLVGISWILTYPLCYWATFKNSRNFFENHTDIAFGAYIFTFTVCLEVLLSQFYHTGATQIAAACLLDLLHVALLFLPFFQIIYYYYYHSSFTRAGALAILQTNPEEAREFILFNYGYKSIIAVIVFFIFLLLAFFKFDYITVTATSLPLTLDLVLLVIVLATFSYCAKLIARTGVMMHYLDSLHYLKQASLFNNYHKDNFAHLQIAKPAKSFAKPSTFILVIGESATRSYMSAYGYQDYDTTPWMKAMSSKLDFLLFKHAYSSMAQTVPSLEQALTEKNQYNNKKFNRSTTILDLAKKCGYTNYWFSAQAAIGIGATPVTLVAKTADHEEWLSTAMRQTHTVKYDQDLLPYLQQVDPTQNNFVVIHLKGSHENYLNRYPAAFAKWGNHNENESVLNYDNSLAYTDQLLHDIYTYGKEHLNLQGLLYFSDHGADPTTKRNPDASGFMALRVPLFLYLSPEYQRLYPETVAALRSHTNSYFTNDLIYEMVAGLLNIHSDHYDESNSLASHKYKYTRETLRTKLGTVKLTEDVDEH